MKVLVIPEDSRRDKYILKPIVEAMLAHLGKTQNRVRICEDPVLGGLGEALKWERLAEIYDRYAAMVDLVLLCVDRDGVATRRKALDGLEARFVKERVGKSPFLAETAWQEVEVWALAGHDLPAGWDWTEIRAEKDVKEAYFNKFVTAKKRLLDAANGNEPPGSGDLAATLKRFW
ncbi:MAG: hypothetical protein GC191_17455 [Azospirillum sp.]|nr:hypothetical protein [Azospirillum sp.]